LEVVVVFPPTDNILVEVEFWIKEREEQEKEKKLWRAKYV
jgi:hypothetical protein